MSYVEREDDVLGYYDTAEEARRERDRFYGPADEAQQRLQARVNREEYVPTVLPAVRRSTKRPGKWYVSYSR